MKKNRRKRSNVKDTKKKGGGIKKIIAHVLIDGIIFIAISEIAKIAVDFVWDKYFKKSDFYLHTEFNAYVAGDVNENRIPIYAGMEDYRQEYAPSLMLSVTNKNEETANIKNVIVEVVDYKDFDQFTIINPSGGADEMTIYYWKCNISSDQQEYYAEYIGADKVDGENLSDQKYVAVKQNDAGELGLMVYPDKPGMYTIKAKVNYTFRDKVQSIESEEMQFVYDPNGEATYGPYIGQ